MVASRFARAAAVAKASRAGHELGRLPEDQGISASVHAPLGTHPCDESGGHRTCPDATLYLQASDRRCFDAARLEGALLGRGRYVRRYCPRIRTEYSFQLPIRAGLSGDALRHARSALPPLADAFASL